jgi:ATP-dependent RNA helicase DDX27
MIFTIDSDEDVQAVSSDDEEQQEVVISKKKALNKKQSKTAAPIIPDNSAFVFEYDDGRIELPVASDDASEASSDIERGSADSDDSDSEDEEQLGSGTKAMPRAEARAARAAEKLDRKKRAKESAATSAGSDSDDDQERGMGEEEEREYFDSIVDDNSGDVSMFSQLNLSRPLLRAVEAAGYVSPTAVQARVIPLALAGRDVCASAVTGSGKTAAFALPFLERLLYRPKDNAAIRVLVVTPTRELATQIYEVITKLSQFTDVTTTLILGGKKDIKSQTVLLRQRPDVVVGTPGRLIDHLRNSASVSLSDLDVLVLDEVDRLLDLGFQEELEELVKYCPRSRQTMLFSATMTAKVEDLVRLSLRQPVRVKTAGGVTTVAPRLVQEFVRVRSEDEREAQLAALLCKSFKDAGKTIVFTDTKKEAHRFCAVIKLLGCRAVELHGDLPQVQRDLAVQKFREHEVDILIATDVAARGLDIQGVRLVLNAEMPRSASTYVHRVGRTARAGTSGRAVTLVSDARRKIMKEVLKGEGTLLSSDAANVLTRTITTSTVTHYKEKIEKNESKLKEAFQEENLKTKLELAMREADRAHNMLLHEDEIHSRPNRTWHQTETQKQETRTATLVAAKKEAKEAELGRKEAARQEMTAQQKAEALARADDYRREEKAVQKGHRLSRKKRRRMEALRENAEEDKNAGFGKGSGDDDNDGETSKMPTKASFGSAKRQAKEFAQEQRKIRGGDVYIADDATQLKRSRQSSAVSRPKFAVGGLEQDDVWGGSKRSALDKPSKKVQAQMAAAADFTEFDASKTFGKGGKKSVNSFKSKKKFKRR